MRMIERKSSAIAGSCHSETAAHTRLRARSTARSRRPLALMFSGLIAIGAIAADTAYATTESKLCRKLYARADLQAGYTAGDSDQEEDKKLEAAKKKVVAKYFQKSSNALDLLYRGIILNTCGAFVLN
jgi:hypothetical protein